MSKLPLEVQLVSDVRECRTCQWFWGGVLPYGDFPVFDWNEDYPEELLHKKQTTEYVSEPFLKVKATGQGQVDPGVMHGCRKAPIMTVGINPNMTSYFASAQGGTWTYPNFSKDERYAYYYRHFTIYQESIDPEFLKQNVIDDSSKLVASDDGWLLNVTRSSDHRWLLLTIGYASDKEPIEIELAWTQKARFILFVNRSKEADPAKLGFRKGELIGGNIAGLEGDNVQINEESTGYYQRYLYVLEKFKEMAGDELAKADLTIGEDVAQHDMIACASPGWSSKYDIPTGRITHNCVQDHAYVVSQIVQSRPALLVIVGGSSMDMFAGVFGRYLTDLSYSYEVTVDGKTTTESVEVFQLLKETCTNEHFLHIKANGYELKTRIVITPHFSYGDNFLQQSRFSESAWRAYESDFTEDAKVLRDADLVTDNSFNSVVPIKMTPEDQAKVKGKITEPGWAVLMAYYYDPIEMMAGVLQQEMHAGRISYDEATKHLQRADGGCRFCVNDLWTFPEGCHYGKDKQPQDPAGSLEAVVQAIVAGG